MRRFRRGWMLVAMAVALGWVVAAVTSKPPPTQRGFPPQSVRPNVVGPSH